MDPSVLGLIPIKGELARALGVKESARRYLTANGRTISRRAALNMWAQYVSGGKYPTYYRLQKALKARDTSEIKGFVQEFEQLTKAEKNKLIVYSATHDKVDFVKGQPSDIPPEILSVVNKLNDRKYDWYRSFYYV